MPGTPVDGDRIGECHTGSRTSFEGWTMTQPHFGQLPAARHMRRKRFSDVRPAALPEAGPASVSSPDASPSETAPADQDAPTASDPASGSPNAGSTVEASESGNVQAERTSAPGTDQRAELHRRKKLVALILVILVVLVIVTLSLALVFLG
jgi:hypothetical protein